MPALLPITTATDDAVLAPSSDATGLVPSILVHLASGMLRVSAVIALASPVLLVAWLTL